ncbi:MAG: hypothetical protein GX639_04725 [Fibrobacter sp.]|nr:hypothetical protein [Fibrobacter sp.]
MIRRLLIAFFAVVLMFGCKIVEEESGGDVFNESTFRIYEADIQGWSFESDWEWAEFLAKTSGSTKGMDELVDGDAPMFVDAGLIKGAAQRLINSNDEKNEIWIMTYPTRDAATKAFNNYIASDKFTKSPDAIAGASRSIALLDNESTDGCAWIAVLGEVVILSYHTNYNNDAKAVVDAANLYNVFKKKQN